ncbi:MAG TPA: 4a-hydroxytetrahydrobiopterin dehydratase [Marinobacter sp.]|nr:4a-hydroxytetrahydrobiopterin dehydratase [Marinobacter sp.]
MTGLSKQACEACPPDTPKVTGRAMHDLLNEVPEWELIVIDGVEEVRREFTFSNFAEALAFANRVGELAEAEKHHPALLVEWGKVTVRWWTHRIEGLHKNDFIMAARTDEVY